MSEPSSPINSLTLALRIDAQCDAFEAALLAGSPVKIEHILEGLAVEERAALEPELAALEIYHRLQRGEKPTAAEYQLRFSQLPLEFLERALAQRGSPLRSRVSDASLRSSQRIGPEATLPY